MILHDVLAALFLIHRLSKDRPNLRLNPNAGGHKLFLGLFIIARKLRHDQWFDSESWSYLTALWHTRYQRIYGLGAREVTRLEMDVLSLIDYCVWIAPRAYNKWLDNVKIRYAGWQRARTKYSGQWIPLKDADTRAPCLSRSRSFSCTF